MWLDSKSYPDSRHLNLVAGVLHLGSRNELLLNRPNVDESGQQVLAAGLVVGTAGSRASEGLLTHNGAGALAVDVEVASGVAELLLGDSDDLTVSGKHGTGETVLGGGVDQLTSLLEGIGSSIVVDISSQDRAEELGGEELVSRVGGSKDGRVNKVALGRVVFAANNQLEVLVRLGLINGT